MAAVLEEETEEQRHARFFGDPVESSTDDDASDDDDAEQEPAPRLAIESEASALLATLIAEVLTEAKTRPERETARLKTPARFFRDPALAAAKGSCASADMKRGIVVEECSRIVLALGCTVCCSMGLLTRKQLASALDCAILEA